MSPQTTILENTSPPTKQIAQMRMSKNLLDTATNTVSSFMSAKQVWNRLGGPMWEAVASADYGVCGQALCRLRRLLAGGGPSAHVPEAGGNHAVRHHAPLPLGSLT